MLQQLVQSIWFCKFQFGIVNSVKSENYLYTGI
uniref:Uncharacterized protein n=1 Tax=virus sp. ctHG14 TaxID=2827626 RepID=A0A8S5RJ88_9VIRU|nr:MAG TPA: hypothetical protein [virus sp. ctHG14]